MEKFIDYFNVFVETQYKLMSVGHVKRNTVKTYRNRTNNFRSFLAYSDMLDITPDKITIRLIRSYDAYLRIEKKHCNDYVMRNIQLVKKMLEEAVEDQVINTNPCRHYKFRFERKKKRVYMDLQELTKFKNCILPNEDLCRNRDVFLFGCYTGFAYCELKNFTKKNLKKGKDGTFWISIIRQKLRNNIDTILPLLSSAREILVKYDWELPVSSNKNMNRSLKKICEHAGIHMPISTHSARKSFGNILINDFGVDLKTVSAMMGHGSITTTEAWYVDVRENKIARDMKDVRSAIW